MDNLVLAKDKEIQQIKATNTTTIGVANSVIVTNEEQAVTASSFVKAVNDSLKNIEEKRLSFTKPLNESLSNINATFKELSAPLTEAKTIVTQKIMTWRKEEQERVEKEEARRRAIQDAHVEQGHQVNAPVVMERPTTKMGNIQTRKVWKFRVVDQVKVPDAFKLINPVMVNEAIRQGTREIPGIEIYQEDIATIR